MNFTDIRASHVWLGWPPKLVEEETLSGPSGGSAAEVFDTPASSAIAIAAGT